MKPWQVLAKSDPSVYQLIEEELVRQNEGIELIASENFAPVDVIAAAANPLTNKYAEGRPGKRYYGGCHVVDTLENLAIERVTKLFACRYANVQPHSGAQANAAVFIGLLDVGADILGLDLAHGGHLTHGAKVNFSGSLYKSHCYTLGEDGLIDMEQVRKIARKVRPRMIIAGASAYPRIIDFAAFRAIADEVGAYLLVDMAHIAGLVATGLHPSPFPHAHVVSSTTHKTLRGPRGGIILWDDKELTQPLNKGVFPGTQGGPLEHIIAAKAVCFDRAAQADFRKYQERVLVNCKKLASELSAYGFELVSGGTDNHLILLDLSKTSVSGKDLEEALEQVNITTNKNTVPNETRSPFVTSGLRIGTAAVSSRGMGEDEMRCIAGWIKEVFSNLASPSKLEHIGKAVRELTARFPLYPEWR